MSDQGQGRRGRRTAAEIRTTLSTGEQAQWCGVVELAAEHGVHKDVVRRAVKAGRFVTRQHQGVTLIDRLHATSFFIDRKVSQ